MDTVKNSKKVQRTKREEEVGLDILVNTVSSADLGARYGGPGDEYDTNKLLSMVNAGFTEREEASEPDSIEVYPGILDAGNADEASSDVDSERGEDGERHGGHKKKKNKTKKVKQPKDKESFIKIILLKQNYLFYFFSLFVFVSFGNSAFWCFENFKIELIQRIRLQK